MSESDLSPVPAVVDQPDVQRRLTDARATAVDLLRQAEDMEDVARGLRRKARARLRHYEQMVAEFQGQMSLIENEEVL